MSIVAVSLVGGAAVAGAQLRGRVIEPEVAPAVSALDMGAEDHPRARQAIAEFLALTEDQVATWDALLATREEAAAPLREQLRATEEELVTLLRAESPDAAAVGALVLAGKSLREGIAAVHESYVEGFEAMLTNEQRGRLGAVRRAARLAPLLPAFAEFGLLGLGR